MKSDSYYGRKAATYETKRRPQQRWTLENEAVVRMLEAAQPRYLVDMPCGTGRFVKVYEESNTLKGVTLVDISTEMMKQAERKIKVKGLFETVISSAAKTELKPEFDTGVCIRFLDLIDETMMNQVVTEMSRLVKKTLICTIRLGDKYVPKSNTATHDRAAFNRLIKRNGWRVEESVPIFNAGWVVLRLTRGK